MHLYCYFDTALRLFLKPDVHTHLIRKNAFLSNNDKFLEVINDEASYGKFYHYQSARLLLPSGKKCAILQ